MTPAPDQTTEEFINNAPRLPVNGYWSIISTPWGMNGSSFARFFSTAPSGPLRYGEFSFVLDYTHGIFGRGEMYEATTYAERIRRCLCEIGRQDIAVHVKASSVERNLDRDSRGYTYNGHEIWELFPDAASKRAVDQAILVAGYMQFIPTDPYERHDPLAPGYKMVDGHYRQVKPRES